MVMIMMNTISAQYEMKQIHEKRDIIIFKVNGLGINTTVIKKPLYKTHKLALNCVSVPLKRSKIISLISHKIERERKHPQGFICIFSMSKT